MVFLFPTSFFLGSVYNDSLFLLLASLTLLFARNKRWVIASIFGGLATLARLNGLALLPFICVEYLTQFYKDGKVMWDVRAMIKDKIYAFCLIPMSFFGYLYYINSTYGSWTLVFTSMKAWNQDKITFPLQVFWRYFKIIVLHPTFKLNYWIAALEVSAVFLFIGLLIYSFKKIRFSYWVFFAVSILIPSLTGTFQGMPRYGLHLYPFFLSLTLFFEKKDNRLLFGYFTICILLELILVALFTRGYFVA
jgi:Gpi18-like mannosyltransferase